MMSDFHIVECPRDAMQGINEFIPTAEKINYLNALLDVGFDTLDFGSFVSPSAVPQMKDTHEVIPHLINSQTKLLAIVANVRGAHDALMHEQIDCLGFPLSISEIFQQRNTNKTIEQSLDVVREIKTLTGKHISVVVYLSMGFGNPYGEDWSIDRLKYYADALLKLDVDVLSIADTVGAADPTLIASVMKEMVSVYGDEKIGAHLHSIPEESNLKVKAAIQAGVKRIDGALLGFGGCPFAENKLTGNIATESILEVMKGEGVRYPIDSSSLELAQELATEIFKPY